MSSSNDIDHDEDITAQIMATLSASLLVNPKFNFGKMMELSTEINSEKNKTVLQDIICLAFLNYLEMNDAAEALAVENIAASAGFQALNLDKKGSIEWFIKFIAVMNPGIIASLSQTLMNIVNGLMLQNTRTNDADRMATVKSKLDTLVTSGELEKRTDKLVEEKPSTEREKKKNVSNLGLIGWVTGYESRRVSSNRRSSSSSTSPVHKEKKSSLKKASKTIENRTESEASKSEGSLASYLRSVKETTELVMPNDSISNASRSSSERGYKKVEMNRRNEKSKGKRVTIRKDDSIVSG